MMPYTFADQRLILILALPCFAWVGGCASLLFRGQDPDSKSTAEAVVGEELEGAHLIGDIVAPMGMNYLKVESVALVTQLDGTGSNPPPSPMRDDLKKEMQTHNVHNPEEAFSSNNTAMVVLRGYIPPAAHKGDIFDVDVQAAGRTETTSLRNGWLMSSRMREHAVMDNAVHSGHVAALAQGPILCDGLFQKSDDAVLETRGRVLGGGVVQIDRPLALVIRDEHTSIKTSTMIGAAINDRFHDFDRGTKRGLANPTRDNYIELKVHSRYREDVLRYIQVVRNITVGETPIERLARMSELEKKLLEPTTSQRAALQLEAIGKDAISILRKGLASSDPEVKFCAAESLAFLDDGDATAALFETAKTERAFRWRAMLALSVLDHFAAQEALCELMNSSSAETRYGAFRALRVRNPRDPAISGEVLEDEFALHAVATTGEPMIHISGAKRPEIVLFGQGQKLQAPSFVFAGKNILIKRLNEQNVKISRFATHGEDQHEICSTDLAAIIRTVTKLGGDYSDVMQMIDESKTKGFLAARVEVNALPRSGRIYHRSEASTTSETDNNLQSPESIPDLFLDPLKRDTDKSSDSVETDFKDESPTKEKRSWFDRLTLWMVE